MTKIFNTAIYKSLYFLSLCVTVFHKVIGLTVNPFREQFTKSLMKLRFRASLRILIVVFVVVPYFLASCATHQSPFTEGVKEIYVTSNEEKIFEAAYSAMLAGRKESPILDMDGSIRGYMLTQRWALDSWTSMIRIFPAKGITSDGEVVTGYYPEVSGEGTLIIRGPAMDKRIYAAALEEFGKVGKKVRVVQLERGAYKLENDRWRLHSKPSLREGALVNVDPSGNHGAVQERLLKAKDLKDKGYISEEEYLSIKSEILKGL